MQTWGGCSGMGLKSYMVRVGAPQQHSTKEMPALVLNPMQLVEFIAKAHVKLQLPSLSCKEGV